MPVTFQWCCRRRVILEENSKCLEDQHEMDKIHQKIIEVSLRWNMIVKMKNHFTFCRSLGWKSDWRSYVQTCRSRDGNPSGVWVSAGRCPEPCGIGNWWFQWLDIAQSFCWTFSMLQFVLHESQGKLFPRRWNSAVGFFSMMGSEIYILSDFSPNRLQL